MIFFLFKPKKISKPKHFNRVIHLFIALLATKWRLLIALCKLARLIKCKIEIMSHRRAYSDWWKDIAWKERGETSFKICLFCVNWLEEESEYCDKISRNCLTTLFGYNHCFQTLNRLQANSKLPCLFTWRIKLSLSNELAYQGLDNQTVTMFDCVELHLLSMRGPQ